MITLILPGYSSKNKEWVEQVAKSLNFDGEIRPIYWDHWTDPSKKFKPKEKARILSDISKNKVVNIIAKSIGTLVASYIIEKIPMQIGKVILCGVPLTDLNEEGVRLLQKIPKEKVTIIQNSNDPLAGSQEIKKLFPAFNIIEKISNTHDYPYFSEFKSFLIT